ncbi:hypothetical protein HMPREF1043_0316 [Streptococcus anginosus subsp. whileyi CCUG 39159]|uniref:Uncharacterized protein n=1 Tax=Streptococcus anginosus subsp. whileyi CCUG 39159 TaxID=1095729 RepID=I0S799_STRAP|nr:hypothetical protein HMPREF1043_0316 [Streptococcus anginosus subsp. whileyi CCUG 39159]
MSGMGLPHDEVKRLAGASAVSTGPEFALGLTATTATA